MAAEPLRILHVLDHSLPLHSGYAFRSHSILDAERRRGLSPVALTSPKHAESWRGAWTHREEFGGIAYYRTSPLSRVGIHALREARLVGALAKRLREVAALESPDLLHAHSPVLNALAALRVRGALRLPVVYEIRAFWEDAAVDHGTYGRRSWKYALVRALETWACRHAQQVVVLCEGLREDLISRGIPAERITVIGNGIDPDAYRPQEPDRELGARLGLSGREVIGFIGSFYRYEGLDLLVQAMALLAARRPSLTLLLVGGGEVESEIRSQIAALGLTGRIILTGRIPQEDIPKIYSLVNVLAYPRRSMRLTELVTPLKPLEAMAMGRALVASDVGGHRELVRHEETGLLVTAGSSEALARALERLLDDAPLRRRLEAQGPQWVRTQRTWERMTEPYAALYARALGSTGRLVEAQA